MPEVDASGPGRSRSGVGLRAQRSGGTSVLVGGRCRRCRPGCPRPRWEPTQRIAGHDRTRQLRRIHGRDGRSIRRGYRPVTMPAVTPTTSMARPQTGQHRGLGDEAPSSPSSVRGRGGDRIRHGRRAAAATTGAAVAASRQNAPTSSRQSPSHATACSLALASRSTRQRPPSRIGRQQPAQRVRIRCTAPARRSAVRSLDHGKVPRPVGTTCPRNPPAGSSRAARRPPRHPGRA